ncbi:MAG: hypothetical protein VB120_08995 [Lachnospiraceae bacterium]|nr:hypothetical protein [Lachnospiraceae bacterium]
MGKKEILEMVIYEMTEKSLLERRETCDEKEQQIYQEVNDLSKRRQKILETLSPEERYVLEDYLVKTNLIADHECKHLYVQGAKDCVELLKKLGVL